MLTNHANFGVVLRDDGTATLTGSDTTQPIPPALQANAERLLDFLQACRDYLGRPIVITSLYRTAEHNTEIGGAAHSQHMNATGADVDVLGITNDAALEAIYQGWQQGYIPEFHQLITYTTDHHLHIGIADPPSYPADAELLRKMPDGSYEVIDPSTLAQVVSDDTSALGTAGQLAGQGLDVLASGVSSFGSSLLAFVTGGASGDGVTADGMPGMSTGLVVALVVGVVALAFWGRPAQRAPSSLAF